MRKIIGTIVICVVLYVGFFGCEKYDIKPFISEWFKGDGPKRVGDVIDDVAVRIDDVAESADRVIDTAINGK